MRKKKLLVITSIICLSIISLYGCKTKETETTPQISYSDLADAAISNNQEDTYSSGNTNVAGEYSSYTDDETSMGTLDYGSLTDEEIQELLNNRKEEIVEEKGQSIELNNAQEIAESSSVKNIEDEDLHLYVSYLLLNVFSNDYVVDVDLDKTQIREALGVEEDKYISAFVQGKNNDNSSFFGVFKVSGKEQCQYLTNHFINYTNSFENDELMANSIIAQKKIANDTNGNEQFIILFVSFDLSNREEVLEIPDGYALVEELEDGTYTLEGEDMYGNIIKYSGKRITMNTNYRELITNKLISNNYEIIK